MVIALLQVRMMKWCTFCYNSMILTAVQAEYNVLFVLVWLDVLWATLGNKFPPGENKVRTLSCAHIYQADSKPKVKLWVQKRDGKLQSRLAEK